MPLMMDDDVEMDIDDLFGDANTLSIPSRSPTKELLQRVDELRRNGCCQAIAWSKWGSIACVSESGYGLDFRNLRCSPRDGTWDLGSPTSLPQVLYSMDGCTLQHLAWSPNGNDLAVIDVLGRVSILTISTALNRPTITRSTQTDALDDLHAIAGVYWLNLMPSRQQMPLIHRRATKTDEGFRIDMSQAIAFGPCHPNPQKSALLSVTTNGILRLLYTQADGRWNELSHEIESVVSSDELITHASICADKNNTILIALATTTKHLRIVRVLIKWGNKPNEKPVNGNQTQLSPQIAVKHVAVTNWMDAADGQDSYQHQSSAGLLSELYIFPPAPDGPPTSQPLPVVMTVCHHLPSPTEQFNHDISTTVNRWEVTESDQDVHCAFEQLSVRRNSTASQPGKVTFLKKLEGFTTNKILLSVEPITFDRILVFGYSDGSVEYRNRWSLVELYIEGSIDQFCHLSQTGFSIDEDEPCTQLAISPTSCSVIKIGLNGQVRWKGLSYQMGKITTPIDDSQYSAIIAGLSMSCATAIMGLTNHDDLIAIARKNIQLEKFQFDWLSEVSRILKFMVDFSEEAHHDNLVRNPSVQFCLSIQSSWGFWGDAKGREFAAKLALIGLQARNCVVLMTMAANMKVPTEAASNTKISGLEDAEAIRILSGSIEWSLDLMSYIFDALLHATPSDLFKSFTTHNNEPAALHSLSHKLQENGNIALHLLLCSSTRGYLLAICRRLFHIDHTARKAMAAASLAAGHPISVQGNNPALQDLAPEHISNSLRQAYTSIATLNSASVISTRVFEQFLIAISELIKKDYTNAGLSSTPKEPGPGQMPNMTSGGSERRNRIEQIMLFGGEIPEELKGTVEVILGRLVGEATRGLDLGKLFFGEYGRLGLDPETDGIMDGSDDEDEGSGKKGLKGIDVFLRMPLGRYPHFVDEQQQTGTQGGNIGKERRYRRCARCASVMEDLHSRRSTVSFLIMQQRRCFCGGHWVVLKEEELGL